MIKYLITIANSLDKKGFKKEADFLDEIIKVAEEDFVGPPIYPAPIPTHTDKAMNTNTTSEHYSKMIDLMMASLISSTYGKSIGELSYERDIEKIFFDRMKELDEIRNKKGDSYIINMYKNKNKGNPEAELLAYMAEDLKEDAIKENLLTTPSEPILASDTINALIKLSNHLDAIGYSKEADIIDYVIKSAKKEKKLTKKQLKALDVDGDKEITEKDFQLLRKKKSKK